MEKWKLYLRKRTSIYFIRCSIQWRNPIYIYIRLRDLFEIQRGKSIYTKTYCKNNKGEYPVYSADNNNPLAYRNDYDYDGEYLTLSINGIAGVLTILDGKFSANADRVIFISKVNNINWEYVKIY